MFEVIIGCCCQSYAFAQLQYLIVSVHISHITPPTDHHVDINFVRLSRPYGASIHQIQCRRRRSAVQIRRGLRLLFAAQRHWSCSCQRHNGRRTVPDCVRTSGRRRVLEALVPHARSVADGAVRWRTAAAGRAAVGCACTRDWRRCGAVVAGFVFSAAHRGGVGGVLRSSSSVLCTNAVAVLSSSRADWSDA